MTIVRPRLSWRDLGGLLGRNAAHALAAIACLGAFILSAGSMVFGLLKLASLCTG